MQGGGEEGINPVIPNIGTKHKREARFITRYPGTEYSVSTKSENWVGPRASRNILAKGGAGGILNLSGFESLYMHIGACTHRLKAPVGRI